MHKLLTNKYLTTTINTKGILSSKASSVKFKSQIKVHIGIKASGRTEPKPLLPINCCVPQFTGLYLFNFFTL